MIGSENKYDQIFTPSGCLTLEAMKKYHATGLTESERMEIEGHLKGCDLCSDALEGLLLISDGDKLNSILSEININLQKNLNKEREVPVLTLQKSNLRLLFAAAASVIILIGIFSYLNFYALNDKSELSVLSPVEYEFKIPDIPLPKILKNEAQESAVKTGRKSKEANDKSFAENENISQKDQTVEIQNQDNYKPDLDKLKNNSPLLTDQKIIMTEDSAVLAAGTKEPALASIDIASAQPVEYYIGGVIIEAENTIPEISQFSVTSKSANTETVTGLISEPGGKKDKSLEKASNRRQNTQKPAGGKNLQEASGMEQPAENDSQSAGHFFRTIDTMPQFPGGDAEMLNYLRNHLPYPPLAKLQGIQGSIYISFIVEVSGKITSVEIIKGLTGECDDAAIKAVQSMPDWQPGFYKGKPVRVRFNMPVTFQLK